MLADLCLVLLLDASGSIDKSEWDLQAGATADAIASRSIVQRMTAGPYRRIKVTALEWAGTTVAILPWMEIAGQEDADRAAQIIRTHRRQLDGPTGVENALRTSARLIQQAPGCTRYVVDISSDGIAHPRSTPHNVVAELAADAITVNAIVLPPNDVLEVEDDAGPWYENLVNGFVMPAAHQGYEIAIKRKLALEIAGLDPATAGGHALR